MRLSWPNRVNSRRTILTDREDVEEEMAVAETPVSAATYDMPSSPGSLSTTNDAATLIASPDHRSGSFPVNNRRISRYGAQQLEAISIVDDEDDDEDDDDYEQKRQLLTDKWRQLFDQFDPEGFGEIPWEDFGRALRSPEFRQHIEPHKIQQLEEKFHLQQQQLDKDQEDNRSGCSGGGHHDDRPTSRTTAITFQDFVNVMSGKRSRSFKCAVHHRDRQVCSENDFHLLLQPPTLFQRMVKVIADEFLTDDRERKYYADRYSCCPPPLFIIFITLVELGFFTYYTVVMGEINPSGPVPINSVFIYRPDKRGEIWRFLCYMVLHAGWLHLLFNLLVQVLVGLPLEMVHGSMRIGAVYMAGVLAGSLGTSVFDTDVYLVGASGGVYALLAAHLANVLLNYNNMEFGIVRLIGIFIVASADVGFAIYDRYAAEQVGAPVSYVAHLTGALAGLTIGLLVLKNFEQKLHEQLIWWVALGVYAACTLFGILFNVFNPDPFYPAN
ncbi:rhomboid-related protein 2-like [Daphnia pulex]|uniref:rhomboid-related protein 2-like n=1 Tax=Daphnia pulex TaxID=6669 RepID=UPI001EDF71B6|nr:rhomboid-related protein 2-like [Daphnia pulex]